VRDDAVAMTNLAWQVSRDAVSALTGGGKVLFLNDLQAQGHALDALDPGHVRPLLRAPGVPDSRTRLVVGIGTGFNAAPVHRSAQGLFVPPSECGHVHLPHHDAPERALAEWLAQRHAVATVEEALSGRGLSAIHAFLGGPDTMPEALVDAIGAGDAAARATGALYARLLGRVLADLALIHLPFGGIWLIGGLARGIGPHLEALGLTTTFHAPGRYAALLAGIDLHLVEDDNAALIGCAAHLNALNG